MLVGLPAHFGLVTAALSTLPEGPGSPSYQLRSTPSTWLSACVSLFTRAEATDHPISPLHHVILGQVMTCVTWIGLTTTWEPVYSSMRYSRIAVWDTAV